MFRQEPQRCIADPNKAFWIAALPKNGVFCIKTRSSHSIGVRTKMPSLIRFLMSCAVLAGIVYGAMVALPMFVEPGQREMTVRIPANKLNPQ